MTAALYKHNIEQGATYPFNFTWKVKSTGAAIDLTGYTAKMQIRKAKDTDVILDLTHSSGITLGGAAGTVAVLLTAAQTAALSGQYVYDLFVVSGGGVATKLFEGTITVDPAVTRF